MVKTDGWKSKESAKHYLTFADILIPYRNEVLEIISALATDRYRPGSKVLDLGCGNGELSNRILEKNNEIQVVMIDYSETMIKKCKERFPGNKDITIICHDLNDGMPNSVSEQRFSVVVSCFALHHIAPDKRVTLYNDTCKVLLDEGIFVNGDRFIEETPQISDWTFNRWMSWVVQSIRQNLSQEKSFEEAKNKQLDLDEKQGDMPGTIWQMRNDLKQAGFAYIDVLWKTHVIGIIAASK
jgi:tRNA (cmo5U34)-methyltransferase